MVEQPSEEFEKLIDYFDDSYCFDRSVCVRVNFDFDFVHFHFQIFVVVAVVAAAVVASLEFEESVVGLRIVECRRAVGRLRYYDSVVVGSNNYCYC